MFFHPIYILFILTLLFSLNLTMSANTWIAVWMGLELNLLSFLPIILKKNNKFSSEASVKYFLIQILASMYLFISILAKFMKFPLLIFFLFISLMLKIGAAPLHAWFPSMIEALDWNQSFILMTIQKFAPLSLVPYLMSNSMFKYMLFLFLMMSSITGAIFGLTQSSLQKILTYSSISHMGWMLMTCLMSKIYLFIYILTYSFMLLPLIMMFNHLQTFYLNQMYKSPNFYFNILLSVSFMSLGGLPPFTGFILKLFILKEFFFTQSMYLMMIILLTSTFLNLFMYFRMMMFYFMLTFNSEIQFFKTTKFNSILLMFNLMGFIFFSAMYIM